MRASRRQFGLTFFFMLAALPLAGSAFAQCTPGAPVNNTTVTCTGTVTNQNAPNGYGTGVENGLTINVQANTTVTGTTSPGNGISVGDGNTVNNLGTVTGPNNNGILAVGTGANTLTVNNSSSATISGLAGVNAAFGGCHDVSEVGDGDQPAGPARRPS